MPKLGSENIRPIQWKLSWVGSFEGKKKSQQWIHQVPNLVNVGHDIENQNKCCDVWICHMLDVKKVEVWTSENERLPTRSWILRAQGKGLRISMGNETKWFSDILLRKKKEPFSWLLSLLQRHTCLISTRAVKLKYQGRNKKQQEYQQNRMSDCRDNQKKKDKHPGVICLGGRSSVYWPDRNKSIVNCKPAECRS